MWVCVCVATTLQLWGEIVLWKLRILKSEPDFSLPLSLPFSHSISLALLFDCLPSTKAIFLRAFRTSQLPATIVLSRRQKLCNKSLFWSDSKPKWCFFTPCTEPFYQPEVIIVVHFLCDFVFPIASVYREKESEPATTIYLLGSLWASYWASDGLRSTMDRVIERYGNSFSTRCGWIVWVFRAIENWPLEAVEF